MSQRRVLRVASACALLEALAGAWAPFPHAQQSPACDAHLAAPANDPYGYRLRGDRCEGIFAREVAGDARLQLVSLTRGFQKFDTKSAEPLILHWAPQGHSPVRLRSYSLRRKLYYRMDAFRRAGDTSYAWPTTLLRDLGLSRDDVGAVGWTTLPVAGVARDVYLPLQISQSAVSDPHPPVEAVILPSAELGEMFLSVTQLRADGGAGAQIVKDRPLGQGFYPAERGVRVTLPLTAPGMYLVEIGATLRSGGSSTTRFWLYDAHS